MDQFAAMRAFVKVVETEEERPDYPFLPGSRHY